MKTELDAKKRLYTFTESALELDFRNADLDGYTQTMNYAYEKGYKCTHKFIDLMHQGKINCVVTLERDMDVPQLEELAGWDAIAGQTDTKE